jgi:ParB family chromosome partitioning protein
MTRVALGLWPIIVLLKKWLNRMADNKKLGKGLSSLLGEKSFSLMGSRSEIPIDSLVVNRNQPRKDFGEESMQELTDSVKKYGVLQPILVRKVEDNYEIIAGERRYRSAKMAGLKTIPAVVKNLDDRESFSVSIVENVQRKDLNPLEEAAAYRYFIDVYGCSQQDVALFTGKSRSHIANLLRLLRLPECVQRPLADGKIEMGHARALIGCAFPKEIVDSIIARKLSVREVEDLIRRKSNLSLDEKINRKNRRLLMEEMESKANELSQKINLQCRIGYNHSTGKGVLTIRFDSLDKLDNFINNF